MGSVMLKDLNDFIQPSTDCIKTTNKKSENKYEINDSTPKSTQDLLKISLKDCLACSGCITTSESLLLQQQSIDEFINIYKSNNYQLILTISPQSLSSLSSYLNHSSLSQTTSLLCQFFKYKLGFVAVFDSSIGRNYSHFNLKNEFISKMKIKNKNENTGISTPLISSSCPGWICYVEKMYPFIIPYLSKTKSPQQMMGYLVKWIWNKKNQNRDNLYHITVMPCADKKLEATREGNEREGKKEVDLVFTTIELLDLLSQFDFDNFEFDQFKVIEFDRLISTLPPHLSHFGSCSGGYIENLLINTLPELFPELPTLSPLNFYQIVEVVEVRQDFIEFTIKHPTNPQSTLFKGAYICGFRNIQNIVRQVKSGKCNYDFIEIYACPTGCINGGGQIKQKVEGVIEKYKEIPIESVVENGNGIEIDNLITSYHAIEKKSSSTQW